MIHKIINELNLENGSNYKKQTLEKYKDNVLLQRVLKLTYDKVRYSFGVTMKNVHAGSSENTRSLEWGLDQLEKLVSREYTGNAAIGLVENVLEAMSEEDREVIIKILGRDLKIRLGRTEINKVFKNLIVKPPYERCEIGTKENILKNMDFTKGVYSQKKEDGTYRSCIISDGFTFQSRPGFEDSFPIIKNELSSLNIDGYVLVGEMTLRGEKDRKKGNGLINSDNPPHDDIIYTVWDMIPLEEYKLSKKEIKERTKLKKMSLYKDRFEKLSSILGNFEHVKLIETRKVNSMKEAFEHFQELTRKGFEGTVIKSFDMTFKDGNSKQQLKVKLQIELDMLIIGFTEGNKGTKNEQYFSGIEFENYNGTIKGTVGVPSLTEDKRDWFHENRDKVIGTVMTVQCNDITKARDNDFYALSHPRFVELRTKSSTDSLERALELKEMAMELKD